MKVTRKQVLAQETLRRLQYPLRITAEEWSSSENPLEYGRIIQRFHRMQRQYSMWVAYQRLNWGSRWALSIEDIERLNFRNQVPHIETAGEDRFKDIKQHEYRDNDIKLLVFKFLYNLKYARDNNNKHLLAEDICKFPIMDYMMDEGPYMAPSDARLGGEDSHIVVQGDYDLIYFVPAKDELTRGRLVECLI